MNLPTIATVEAWLHALDALGQSPRKGVPSPAATVRRRLLGAPGRPGALRRELAHGTTTPDGMPARTPGHGDDGGGGGGSELTPTEAAAEARLRRPETDEHRAHTLKACDALADLVHAADRLLDALDLLDGLNDGGQDTGCAACYPHREVIADVYVAGTVGGRLAEPAALCERCYDFVRRLAPRLPTAAEVAHHERRGRWPRIR